MGFPWGAKPADPEPATAKPTDTKNPAVDQTSKPAQGFSIKPDVRSSTDLSAPASASSVFEFGPIVSLAGAPYMRGVCTGDDPDSIQVRLIVGLLMAGL